MQNDKIKNKNKVIKRIQKKKLSQHRLTRLVHHSQYEIRIKKIDFQEKDPTKKSKLNKKNIE